MNIYLVEVHPRNWTNCELFICFYQWGKQESSQFDRIEKKKKEKHTTDIMSL